MSNVLARSAVVLASKSATRSGPVRVAVGVAELVIPTIRTPGATRVVGVAGKVCS